MFIKESGTCGDCGAFENSPLYAPEIRYYGPVIFSVHLTWCQFILGFLVKLYIYMLLYSSLQKNIS